MPKLIKDRRLQNDTWQLLDRDLERWLAPGEDGLVPDFPDAADLIVPLKLWRLRREDLLDRPGRSGVSLAADEDPAALAADLDRLPLVAVHFPKFSDGRGFSTARLLRERYAFTGELRAIGDVLRDQLLFLARCGFDAFALRDDQDAEAATAAFDDFTEAYQGGVDQPAPLFRRRLAAGASR
ncbi:MAG: DUF934 domain-containing protein [Burkholderiales bacterium]